MLGCKVDREDIKTAIENSVSAMAEDTGLFEKVSNTILVPVANLNLVNEAAQYKGNVKSFIYAGALDSSPRMVLKDIADQSYGRTGTGQISDLEDAEKDAVQGFGQELVDLAKKVYPLTLSPNHRAAISNINNEFQDEVLKPYVGHIEAVATSELIDKGLAQVNKDTDNLPETKSETLFQLSNMMKEADQKLNQKLIDFLRPLGVRVEHLDTLKERTGVDAIGATDIINRLILINQNKASLDTLPEETAHFFVELLGNQNLHVKTLMYRITEWEGYQAIYDEYKDIYNGNEQRIRKEAVGKLIAEHIVDKRNTPKSFLQHIQEFINAILKLFGLGTFDIEGIAEDIAIDILTMNYSKIQQKLPSGARLVDYAGTLEKNPIAQEVAERIKSLGFYLTGSLALRRQGTVYRDPNEPIHDLDFRVPLKFKDSWREIIEKEFGTVQQEYSFERKNEKIEGVNINDITVDFFIRQEEKDPTASENTASWQSIFAAKLGMDEDIFGSFGRTKDITDFLVFEPFERSEGFNEPAYVYFQLAPNDYVKNATDYFTEAGMDEKVGAVLKEIPTAMVKLKKIATLQSDKKQAKVVQSLIDSYNEIQDKGKIIPVYINMLVTAGKITYDLNAQLLATHEIKDDLKRIYALQSLLIAADNLQFIVPLVRQIVAVMNTRGFDQPKLSSFVTRLNGILAIESTIKQNAIDLLIPATESFYASQFPDNGQAMKLREQIKELELNLKQTGISEGDKKKWTAKIETTKKMLLMMPTPETFKKIFAGMYMDSSSLQMLLEAPAMNAHPLIGGSVALIRRTDTEVVHDMINIENEHFKQFDKTEKKLKLGLGTPKNTWKEGLDEVNVVEDVEENDQEEAVPKLMKIRMFSSPYTAAYLEQQFLFKGLKAFFYEQYLAAKRVNDDIKMDKYYAKYEDILNKKMIWEKENSERKYKDEVYDMFALLDQKISKPDGTTTSFRKERQDIFWKIEALEHTRNATNNMEGQKEVQDEIRKMEIELREIRSIYDKDGISKTGVDLELSNIANKYYELRGEYGESILTEEGQASFDREKMDLDQRLARNQLSQQQYDGLLSDITTTVIDPIYFEKISEFTALIQEATAKIAEISELADIIGNVDKEVIKNGYAKIKELVSRFRDSDGVIDGILFTKVKPQLIKEIRDIQQAMEDLKNKASKLKGLSVEDSLAFDKLLKKVIDKDITVEEQNEYDRLLKERTKRRQAYKRKGLNRVEDKLYTELTEKAEAKTITPEEQQKLLELEGFKTRNNRKLIDGYYELLSGLTSLMSSKVSHYYNEAIDNQMNWLTQSLKPTIRDEVAANTSLENGTFFRSNGAWWKKIGRNETTGETHVVQIVNDSNYSDVNKVIDEIAVLRAKASLEQSKWWKENHYDAYDFEVIKDNGGNVLSSGYVPVERPIYIWVNTQPKDESYIKRGQPSHKFKTYQFNADRINEKHEEIQPFIPINKADKYRNQRYFDLQKNNPVMFEYMEFLRKAFKETQDEVLNDNQKLGDILPGIPMSPSERLDASVRNLFDGATYRNLFTLGMAVTENEDTQMLLGGSQSKYYSHARILPMRFIGRVPIEQQSADIPGMILSFILASKKFSHFSKIQPVLEATRTIVQNLSVTENVNIATKLGFIGNIVSAIRGDANKKEREKFVEKESNLAKSMNFVLDTFVYGQTKDSAISQIGGMTIDWQKLSSGLRHLYSLSVFSLKSFIAIKNTTSAKVQGVIFANYGSGFYTGSDFAWANWKAKDYVMDHLRDYKKFGDKSFIGQALEYFLVLHGTTYDQYGRLTQFTLLKNWENWLTLLKNASEFELQVTQFLAMSRANKVKLGDNMVDFIDAYELDKQGNFTKKAGADITKEQEDIFIGKIEHINRMINGAYRQDERNYAQKSVLGGMAFYLNGYVMPGIISRFGGLRYNIEADMFIRGSWNQTFNFMGELLKYRRGLTKEWAELTPEERNRVIRFWKEIGFILGFAALVFALGGGDDKDELRKNAAAQNYFLALAMMVKSETETFTPLPAAGLNELSRKINSPFAALRQITSILKMLENGTGYLVGAESAFYKTQGINDGFHDKGDAKVIANFLKFWGATGLTFDPLDKVVKGRQIQQLR